MLNNNTIFFQLPVVICQITLSQNLFTLFNRIFVNGLLFFSINTKICDNINFLFVTLVPFPVLSNIFPAQVRLS
jgi:hypothetical protein